MLSAGRAAALFDDDPEPPPPPDALQPLLDEALALAAAYDRAGRWPSPAWPRGSPRWPTTTGRTPPSSPG